jgi:hypothetical protein
MFTNMLSREQEVHLCNDNTRSEMMLMDALLHSRVSIIFLLTPITKDTFNAHVFTFFCVVLAEYFVCCVLQEAPKYGLVS